MTHLALPNDCLNLSFVKDEISFRKNGHLLCLIHFGSEFKLKPDSFEIFHAKSPSWQTVFFELALTGSS